MLVAARPDKKSSGIILHLRELEGKSVSLSLNSIFKMNKIKSAQEVNVLGEAQKELKDTIDFKAYQTTFIKIEF